MWARRGRNGARIYLLKGDLNHHKRQQTQISFLKRPRICWPHVFHYIFILRDKESACKINKLCICIYKCAMEIYMLRQSTERRNAEWREWRLNRCVWILFTIYSLISTKKNEILLLHLRCLYFNTTHNATYGLYRYCHTHTLSSSRLLIHVAECTLIKNSSTQCTYKIHSSKPLQCVNK